MLLDGPGIRLSPERLHRQAGRRPGLEAAGHVGGAVEARAAAGWPPPGSRSSPAGTSRSPAPSRRRTARRTSQSWDRPATRARFGAPGSSPARRHRPRAARGCGCRRSHRPPARPRRPDAGSRRRSSRRSLSSRRSIGLGVVSSSLIAAAPVRVPGRAPREGRAASGRVTSITEDGTPPSGPPSTSNAAAARSCSGTWSSRAGSGPPRRLALVMSRPPAPSARSATPGSSRGTRRPMRSGASPQRWARRPAGLGTIKRVWAGQQRPAGGGGARAHLRQQFQQRRHRAKHRCRGLGRRPLFERVQAARRRRHRRRHRRSRRRYRSAAAPGGRRPAAAPHRPGRLPPRRPHHPLDAGQVGIDPGLSVP